jgi:hypothetical protein
MDTCIEHLLHALVLTIVLYLIMKYVIGQSHAKALCRSVVIGLAAALYMVLFGHGPPTKLNPALS